MNKISCVIYAPVNTYSGYGARSRDLIKALIKNKPDWEISIISCRWGNTRMTYLEDHQETELLSKIIPSIPYQPDVFISITVPNEFQKVGKYNIGITAGIETTLADPSWIEGCNRMDLVLTSSEHAKHVFEESVFNIQDNRTGQITGTIKLNSPVEVLLEGVDTEKYRILPTSEVSFDLSGVKETYCYLVVGHWMQGILGEDRKNIGYTIKSFLETFKNKQNSPALLLKVQAGAGTSIMDRETLLDRIDAIRQTVKGTLPNIYILHGELSDEEMNELYNHPKVKTMVTLTKGEGFGRPLLEFSTINKPIIASSWSGHLDFLDSKFTKQVSGTLKNIDTSAAVDKMILREAQWFSPNPAEVGLAFKELFTNYAKWLEQAKRQGHRSRTEFSFTKMVEKLGSLLDKYKVDEQKGVGLKLPELRKIELPKLKKID